MPEVKRTVLIGWIGCCLCGLATPLVRAATGVPGSGIWPVLVSVALMAAVAFFLPRQWVSISVALTMNLSGLMAGGALGFVVRGVIDGSPSAYFFAAKWAVFCLLITAMLLREMKATEERDFQGARAEEEGNAYLEAFEAMEPEQRAAEVKRSIAEAEELLTAMRAQSKRMTVVLYAGIAVTLVGIALVVFTVISARHR